MLNSKVQCLDVIYRWYDDCHCPACSEGVILDLVLELEVVFVQVFEEGKDIQGLRASREHPHVGQGTELWGENTRETLDNFFTSLLLRVSQVHAHKYCAFERDTYNSFHLIFKGKAMHTMTGRAKRPFENYLERVVECRAFGSPCSTSLWCSAPLFAVHAVHQKNPLPS